MSKPKLSLKRRLIRLSLWLVSIAVVFIAYSELLGWQTFAVWMAYNVTKRCPQVNNLPQPLHAF